MPIDSFNSLQTFKLENGSSGTFHSLPKLEADGVGKLSRLPVSIRIVLESVLRNCDGRRIRKEDVQTLANWKPVAERTEEIPFMVARVLLQDFTGVPLLVDLAAMRSAVSRFGKDPGIIEPLVPVDLVVDHSVQVDYTASSDALRLNMEMEFKRNRQRYQFLKWGTKAFNGFQVVPPGIGIVHQVNLEHLAKGVVEKDGVFFPDTLVGTDSHTTMINGLGIVAWGVGGIEAEAAMLGQPVYFLTPDVVGVNLTGALNEGVTATDLVLRVTEMLRKTKVVGKFVEYFGEGAASLSLADRATIANMAPEYGATMGFFPVDEESCKYLELTGRSADHVDAFRSYFKAQKMFGMPLKGEIDYSMMLELDLSTVLASVSGPKRPQDRIELADLKDTFNDLLQKPTAENGYNKPADEVSRGVRTAIGAHSEETPVTGGGEQDHAASPVKTKNTSELTESEMMNNRPTPDRVSDDLEKEFPKMIAKLHHGDVLIAAITSCTNTSNPSVMLAAGLLAKKAVQKGLKVSKVVKTSLAPGSRVVTDYFQKSGLNKYLDALGFNLVGYGCTTCIGNSGPLDPRVEEAIVEHDIIGASVLSGNRNFEARVHQSIKANFLMSPPLVVAFALAGRVDIDLTTEPIGRGDGGKEIFLRDIWPSLEEVRDAMRSSLDPASFRRLYKDFERQNPLWEEIPANTGELYEWEDSTYIQEPPFFANFAMEPGKTTEITNARPLAIFGDSVTTDHISPAGSIKASSPAGRYLQEKGVTVEDFNSYGSRRGNDKVMTRGTFANVRIRNLMVPGSEGGVTVHQPEGTEMPIFDAALKYQGSGTALVILAGHEYGTGSSRDWAAKGAALLGVRAVIARSFERIHRSNLVGMGVLPCQFDDGISAQTLGLTGTETFDLTGLGGAIRPRQKATLVIRRPDGTSQQVQVTVRIDTPIEVDYYIHGGILPYVLRQLISGSEAPLPAAVGL
ncbi:MAG TPA: aconitate hydratase [Thermoanaerobaculia bacterium]|nr:aconitate hydratase [Thermoanaerobaculia bacterium]